MKLAKYAGLAGALLTSLPAHAAPVPDADLSAAYKSCMAGKEAMQRNLSAMLGCTQSELTVRNAELNRAYEILMASLDGDQRPGLLAAQNAWIAFRDANCEQKNSTGEDDDVVGRQNCILQMTIERTKEIQDMLDDD